MPILDLTLADGRKVWAESVHVTSTYAGLIEGYPRKPSNDQRISDLPETAAEMFGVNTVHVLEPPRRPGTRPLPSSLPPAEYLPNCTVMAEFVSLPIDEANHASTLILCWFQEEPFPVPSDEIRLQIEALPWNTLALDFEY